MEVDETTWIHLGEVARRVLADLARKLAGAKKDVRK